jgi:type IV secretory pathway TraG/TraD family ATPase VirD4
VLKVEEKNKENKFTVYLILVIIFGSLSLILGTGLTLFMDGALTSLEGIEFTSEYIITLIKDAIKSENFLMCTGGCFAVFLLMIFLSATKGYNNTPKTLTNKNYDVDSDKKGSARWLNTKEINKYFPRCAYDEVGKYKINGFVIQTIDVGARTFANYKDGVHCLIIGTTGSGKTIRFVIPTMQFLARSALRPSIVVTDPKGELYFSQSGLYQKRGYEVLTLNLREPLKRSSCWNPCHIAYEEYQEGLRQKELIKFHSDSVDNYKGKLKLAESKDLFHEQWYEFNGYAFANLKSAMTEAERREGSMKSKAQESISDLVQTIYAESARKASDPFWTKSAASLVEGLLLAMLEDSEIPNLGITAERFNLGTISSTLSLRVDQLKSYFAIRDVSSNAKRKAQGPLGAPTGGTQESIISTAMADLSSFADPDIQYITCNNDIDFKDMGRKPTVVFLIIPDEKENRHIFASLFITQAYKQLVELASGDEGVNGSCPHPVNFIIDEFANMPVIPGMENKITVARSRGISFMLIIQALSQLRAKYGPDVAEIIRSNCNLQVFLATNDNETAEYFSKICGEKTIKDINSSVGQDGKVTESYSLSSRALITPSELLTLPEGVSIAKLLRTQPAKVKQTAFWKSKAYDKGEQVIETKWNPNLFVFDKDGFYDIVERNRSEVDYLIDDVAKYDVKELIEARKHQEDEEDGDNGTDDRMEHIDEALGSELFEEETKESKPQEESSKATEVSDDLSDLFADSDVNSTQNLETVTEEKNNDFNDDFNFDDIDFNFDDILNDAKMEDKIADTVEITNAAYKEVAEEKGIKIDDNEYADNFDFLDNEFLKINSR